MTAVQFLAWDCTIDSPCFIYIHDKSKSGKSVYFKTSNEKVVHKVFFYFCSSTKLEILGHLAQEFRVTSVRL